MSILLWYCLISYISILIIYTLAKLNDHNEGDTDIRDVTIIVCAPFYFPLAMYYAYDIYKNGGEE